MQLRVVLDCLFRAIGPQLEMMLRTEVPRARNRQLNLYRLLDVLANAEEDRNRYRSTATSARIMQRRMESYASAAGITLRGTTYLLPAHASETQGQASGSRPSRPAGPPPKMVSVNRDGRPNARPDNRRNGPQRTPEWRANSNRTQQSRSGFALRSHQTLMRDIQELDGDDVGDKVAAETNDAAETTNDYQTEADEAAYDDADIGIITFNNGDDSDEHWAESTSHHVRVTGMEATADSAKYWQLSEFDWCAEPLEPQLARAMGVTELHKLEVTAPSTNQVGPVGDERHTLISELGKVEQRALSKARFVPTKPQPKWTVPIRLAANGQDVSTITEVDTGSSMTLILRSIVERLGGKVEVLPGLIHLAGETTLPHWGRCTVMLSTADHSYVLRAEAFPQEITPPVLLGIDVIEQYGLGELLAGVKHRADHPVADNNGDDIPERIIGDDSEHREDILRKLKSVLEANAAIDLNQPCLLPGAVVHIPFHDDAEKLRLYQRQPA
ncbi:hypothetical protein H4R20_005868, partial [Coemansia guatemalensis]